jgi:hypothetical protein
MALPDFYRRRKRANQPGRDVYQYTDFPNHLRVQVVQIFNEAIGPANYNSASSKAFKAIVEILRKEFGVFDLHPDYNDEYHTELFNWLLNEPDIDKLLEGIEVTLRIIDRHVRDQDYQFPNRKSDPDEAIAEFNARLLEAGVGFQYDGGDIIQMDSLHLHAEVVLPALRLIADPDFASVDEEYREAHQHFRSAEYETCLVDCGKAFESCLKIIGTKRRWDFKPTDPASKLIAAAYSSGFIPTYLQAEFTALRSLLESGVPTVRNKQGGHGAGATPRVVPKELAALQLHQTAAVIVFLIEHHKANPQA